MNLIQEAVRVRAKDEFDVSCCCVIIITADTRDLNNIIITFNNNNTTRVAAAGLANGNYRCALAYERDMRTEKRFHAGFVNKTITSVHARARAIVFTAVSP